MDWKLSFHIRGSLLTSADSPRLRVQTLPQSGEDRTKFSDMKTHVAFWLGMFVLLKRWKMLSPTASPQLVEALVGASNGSRRDSAARVRCRNVEQTGSHEEMAIKGSRML